MARGDDDFVLTIDDEENLPEEEDVIPLETTSTNKKRKRDTESSAAAATGAAGKKSKTSKKSKTAGAAAAAAAAAAAPLNGASDDEEAEEKAKFGAAEDDGAIDPDFEFQLGGDDALGNMDDFDGWAEGTAKQGDGALAKGGNKRAVDIDEIIARRKSKSKSGAGAEAGAAAAAADSDEEDVDGFEGFDGDGDDDDDELLADDAFGMGAEAGEESESEGDDEEDEKGSDDEDGEGSESGSDDGDDDADEDEDEDVAAPVSHPMDEASDASDDEAAEDDDAEEMAKRDAFFAPEENNGPSGKPVGSFQDMSLSRPILKGLSAVGFNAPTPIQHKTIPVALLGKDVVGGAVTGSGKTGAFIIPILERLLYRPKKVATTRVAILMPTRELAIQCYNVATKLASFTDITFGQAIGGMSSREQENILKQRPDIVIATPGRFIDFMRNSASFDVSTIEILVLDEADRMLEDGFADELNEILTTIPKSRQTMLFSATMTSSVDSLIRVGLNRPVRLLVDAERQTVSGLTQEFVRLRPGREDKRIGYLLYLCKQVFHTRTIIFFRQKKEAHRVRIIFALLGLKAAELHGSMSQDQRISAIDAFRSGSASFLLATDLASRGLDIKNVEVVINNEAPQSHEIYLHRVGRTARAGRSGRACTLAAEPDRKVVKAAVKTARAQGAIIKSRVISPADADAWADRVDALEEEIAAVMKEEKEEKVLATTEMQMRRTENIMDHRDEILARPKKTWFESEKDKKEAKARGRAELNGAARAGIVDKDGKIKKEKRKLSGKEKKKLEDRDERREGGGWKKGKAERDGKGVIEKAKQSKSKTKAKAKGKGRKGMKGAAQE